MAGDKQEPLFINGPESLKTLKANGHFISIPRAGKYVERSGKQKVYPQWEGPVEYKPRLPDKVFVAPGFELPGSINNTGVLNEKFVFMDCGRWLSTHRNFGLIWGRHVYLCNYFDGRSTTSQAGTPFSSPFLANTEPMPDPNVAGSKLRDGPDKAFFKEMNDGKRHVRIIGWAVSEAGTENDYDWDNLYIVIPDLHLMAPKIGEIWARKESSANTFNKGAEEGLYYFAEALLKTTVKSKIRIVQIGDCYDLWVGHGFDTRLSKEATLISAVKELLKNLVPVGPAQAAAMADSNYEPLFEVNDRQIMELYNMTSGSNFFSSTFKSTYFLADIGYPTITGSYQYLTLAIQHIQGTKNPDIEKYWPDFKNNDTIYDKMWSLLSPAEKGTARKEERKVLLNPAELALRILEKELGKDKVIYIYGNHDNYLIDDSLCSQAALKPRQECFEVKSLFFEHPHRLEKFTKFTVDLLGLKYELKNYDGIASGFVITNVAFNATRYDAWEYLRKTGLGMADASAATDQAVYKEQFARFLLGRAAAGKTIPRIVAIGHTHLPHLASLAIDAK